MQLLFSFYRSRNYGTEKFGKLPMLTKLVSDWARNLTKAV